MGRRIGNAFARDKGQSSASHDASEDDPNKTPGYFYIIEGYRPI